MRPVATSKRPLRVGYLSPDFRSTLPGDKAEAWAFLWEDIPAERNGRRAYQKRGRKLGLRDRAKAEPEHTYLLRAVLPGEHDILVAFRDVHRDDHGHTLVFRELGRWDAPR